MKLYGNEKAKEVLGFEDRYIITSHGRIYSLKKRRFLRPSSGGYMTLTLYGKDKTKNVSIHRLVASAFIENTENKKYVNHIDGNKYNNSVDNLEWVTSSENALHAFNTGLRKSSEKQREWARKHAKDLCKKTRKKIKQINNNGEVVMEYESIRAAARVMNVSHQALLAAIKNNNKSCNFKWEVE